MKLFLTIWLAGLAYFGINAQNLVFNGGFEDTVDCNTWIQNPWPNLPSKSWYQSIASPDYFSMIYTSFCGVNNLPNNFLGYQLPKTGVACAGYSPTLYPVIKDYKEAITGKLIDTLKSNHIYLVSVFINAANESKIRANCIDIYFSEDSLHTDSFYLFNIIPQLTSNNLPPFVDTLGWTNIKYFYKAVGYEKWITIGCLNKDSSIKLDSNILGSQIGAYYFLDDVSVIDCTATALSDIEEIKLNVWYDATNNKLVISTNEQIENYTLIDMLGKTTLQGKLLNSEISAAALSRGVYMLVVEDKRYRRRVFKVGVY
ncbi:MAG: T9SS type A sorting domain-containing protein [Bacteroidetes bacterium]|nr:T9SS type A sorting domain-containing protein [Bacteroidota bacterium]